MMAAIIILLILIALAARAGVSYIVQYRGHAAVNAWWKQPVDKQPSLVVWKDMLNSVDRTLSFDPKNPDLYEVKGRIYYYRANFLEQEKRKKHDYFDKAKASFQQVTQLRPTWPYGYLNLLFTKLMIQEFDGEMNQSLQHLIHIGPWEKAVLSDLVKVILYTWPNLNVESKEVAKKYLQLVAEKRTGELRRVLKDENLKRAFCKDVFLGKELAECL